VCYQEISSDTDTGLPCSTPSYPALTYPILNISYPLLLPSCILYPLLLILTPLIPTSPHSSSPLSSLRCYETFDEGSEFFIVTELVAGGELFDRIVAKTHYTEKEARDLVKMFLETMAYMHCNGVVHRDLKPENLLLCSGGS
jgi:Protein kinase domain